MITEKLKLMYKLNLPNYPLRFKKEGYKKYVFDFIRKKYYILTPEEFVRQKFLHYMVKDKDYPASLTAVEMSLKINSLNKRADIVVFDIYKNVKLIVECKAPEVNITQKTFDQVVRYNMNFKADYLIMTNGFNHYCCKPNYTENNYTFVNEIPNYKTI